MGLSGKSLHRIGWALAVLGVLLCVQAPAAGASAPHYDIFDIAGVGTVPGVDYLSGADYVPLVLSDPTDLTTIHFQAGVDTGDGCDEITTLPTGQRYTLISSTGGLTGALEDFDGNSLPEGSVIPLENNGHDCFHPFPAKLQLHYDETGPLPTVTGTVVDGAPTPVSEIQLGESPEHPQVNQPVTITATVTTSAGTPTGTVAFDVGEQDANSACAHQPVVPTGRAYAATCTVSLPSTFGVGASFTPTDGNSTTGSSWSNPWIGVHAGTTTTSLHLPHPAPVNELLAATATVTPAYEGSTHPQGTVAFSEDGVAVPECAAQPLPDAPAPSVTCAFKLNGLGIHQIGATFVPTPGDPLGPPVNFEGSTVEQDIIAGAAPIPIPSPEPPPTPALGTITVAPAPPPALASGQPRQAVVVRPPHRARARHPRKHARRVRHCVRRTRRHRCTTIRHRKHTRGAGRRAG